MKKIFFLYSLFLVITTSCSQIFISDEEIITIPLPQWPSANSESKYPELSRWLLKCGSSTFFSSQYLSPQTKMISFTVKKNQPFCATLLPITKLSQNENTFEVSYFHSAGYIYPYKNSIQGFTWEQGYLADIMLKIIKSKDETGLTNENINTFLSSFNWKKAQETIENKINEKDNEKFYNPWLIETSTLLENLSYGYFKSTYLNNTSCYSINVQTLFPDTNCSNHFFPLSPFIPENKKLIETNQITIKKNIPTLLSDGKTGGALITIHSIKNISKEIVIMPIYIEDI